MRASTVFSSSPRSLRLLFVVHVARHRFRLPGGHADAHLVAALDHDLLAGREPVDEPGLRLDLPHFQIISIGRGPDGASALHRRERTFARVLVVLGHRRRRDGAAVGGTPADLDLLLRAPAPYAL